MARQRFVTDAPSESFDSVETDGVEVDDDDGVSFEWSEIPVVEIDSPPHEAAFDTDQFYKIEGVTVGRPINQLYVEDDEVKQLKKPADELAKSAWSFDNVPHTCEHPSTGMVTDVRDITGFWRGPQYDRDDDRMLNNLYVPTNDEDAKEYIEQNPDVSMGYYDERVSEYDGDTGSLAADDVDGFQTNMIGNHIASVERGRCSGEDGCGLDDGIHGRIYDESTTDEGDSESCNCDRNVDHDVADEEENMGDKTNDGGDDDGFTVNLSVDADNITVDTLAERFDAVADLRDRNSELESAMDEVRDEMGLDDDECPCDHIDEVVSDAEKVEQFRDELDEYRADEKEEVLDELEQFGIEREEWEDESLDALEDELERCERVAENFDTSSIKNDAAGSSGDEDEDTTPTVDSPSKTLPVGYNAGPQN